jgi:hypothetical protein
MIFLIHARDGASKITLRRETRDAALKKAGELEHHGWFDVEVELELMPSSLLGSTELLRSPAIRSTEEENFARRRP